MLNIVLTIAAASLIAATPSSAPKDTKAEQLAKGRNDVAKSNSSQKICMKYDDLVGSRVRRDECKTKAQWIEEGVDFNRDLKS